MHLNFKDIKIVDYVGPMGPASYTERRYLFDIAGKQAWFVAYSTNNMSGATWELVDGDVLGVLPETEQLVDDIPESVSQHMWDEVPPTLDGVVEGMTNEFEEAYWEKFDQDVQPALDAMNKEIFPWQAS